MRPPVTTFRLVRHAAHRLGENVLAGRTPAVSLTAEGREQARKLAQRPWAQRLDLIVASPRERAIETAAPIARAAGREIVVSAALDEVDFGCWTGRSFRELEQDPAWRTWNSDRARAKTPAGHSMRDLEWRAWNLVQELNRSHAGGAIALVTHAEIVRALLLRAHAIPPSRWFEIPVPLAACRVLALEPGTGKVCTARLEALPCGS